ADNPSSRGPPRDTGAGIIREDAKHVDLVKALEFATAQLGELSAKYEMQQLFFVVGSSADMDQSLVNAPAAWMLWLVKPMRTRFRDLARARLARRGEYGRRLSARHAPLAARGISAVGRQSRGGRRRLRASKGLPPPGPNGG